MTRPTPKIEIKGTGAITKKAGITVLRRTGAKVDAAAAVVAEREALQGRSLRR